MSRGSRPVGSILPRSGPPPSLNPCHPSPRALAAKPTLAQNSSQPQKIFITHSSNHLAPAIPASPPTQVHTIPGRPSSIILPTPAKGAPAQATERRMSIRRPAPQGAETFCLLNQNARSTTMATAAQQSANKEIAKHSTGPRTAEGKQRS